MVPFYRPYYNRAELLALFRSDINRANFESAVAARAGARYSLAFGYGRAGLLAVFKALGLTRVEVIVPAYLCQVVAQTIVAAGNSLRFVDIDLGTYNMDMRGLKEALTSQSKVILAIHMYGYPVDISAIRAAVGDEHIMILEDSALAPLRFTPQNSDLTLFSFGVGKPLTTVQGGVIATSRADLYDKISAYRAREMNTRSFHSYKDRFLRLGVNYLFFGRSTYSLWHKMRRRQPPRAVRQNDALKSTSTNSSTIQQLPPDLNVAYSDFQARLGMAQLDKLETILSKRRRLAEIYDQELAGLKEIIPAPILPGATYAYYAIRVPKRDESSFRRRMVSRGVALDRTYEYILPQLKPYRSFAEAAYPYDPYATRAAARLLIYLAFPIFQRVRLVGLQFVSGKRSTRYRRRGDDRKSSNVQSGGATRRAESVC